MRSLRFYDYIVSEDGTIESLLTNKKISKRVGPNGYYQVNLCINGKCKTFMLHRIIGILFIENPNNYPCLNHKDGNKLNNDVSNLEWVTHKENVQHANRNGLINHAKGTRTNNGRFNEDDIRKIRQLFSDGKSKREISVIYGVTKSAISQILSGKTYKWVS
jgi:hypothetical protein